MEIKNVIICGLGALGITYANKLKNVCNLKILADKKRIANFKKNPPFFNNEPLFFNHISPKENQKTDLIIIATKYSGLSSAIEYIKNFVSKDTIIISLINGISSEKQISLAYPEATILNSFFIGHSAIGKQEGNTKKFYQDGIGKIVFEPNSDLENFFKTNNIDYEISENIIYSQWVKLGVNIILNELSAIYRCSVGELRKNKDYPALTKILLKEIKAVAFSCKIDNLENYEQDVLNSANLVANDGITSMYQDIIAKKKTEIDIFSGEIIKLGKLNGVKTPYNIDVYNKIKDIEKDFL